MGEVKPVGGEKARPRPPARFWLCLAVALIGGVVVGVIDLNAAEVQPAVLLVLLFSGLLGLARPGYAWLWALVVGGGAPLAQFIGPALGCSPPYAVAPNRWASALALVPAFAGAYAGAVVHWTVKLLGRRGRARPE